MVERDPSDAVARLKECCPDLEVQSLLWDNGKAVTFLCRHTSGNCVAKVLTESDPSWAARYRWEIEAYSYFEAMGGIQGIPRSLGCDSTKGVLLLEYLEGESLSSERSPIDPYMLSGEAREVFALLKRISTKVQIGDASVPNVISVFGAKVTQYGETGVLLTEDVAAIQAVLLRRNWQPAMAQGDANPTNLFRTTQGIYLLDWEFLDWQLPHYDLAGLWSFSLGDHSLRDDIVGQIPKSEQAFFWASALVQSARNLKSHLDLDESHPWRVRISALTQTVDLARSILMELVRK